VKFGNAKLYRKSRTGYEIGVFAGPREETREDGTLIYQIGFDDDARVYVIPEADAGAFPIYERELKSTAKVADDFEEWLTESCDRVRNSYGTKKWEEILRGPDPFSSEEREMLEARRRISWLILGIDADGNQIIEVSNAGSRALPVLESFYTGGECEHDKFLCQRELSKAIYGCKDGLNLTSWLPR